MNNDKHDSEKPKDRFVYPQREQEMKSTNQGEEPDKKEAIKILEWAKTICIVEGRVRLNEEQIDVLLKEFSPPSHEKVEEKDGWTKRMPRGTIDISSPIEPEEGQEELWYRLINECVLMWHSPTPEIIKRLQKKFTLKRK